MRLSATLFWYLARQIGVGVAVAFFALSFLIFLVDIVELAGDYFDLMDLLDDVAHELGFVVIKDYKMTVDDDRPRAPRISTSLLMAAYRTENLS